MAGESSLPSSKPNRTAQLESDTTIQELSRPRRPRPEKSYLFHNSVDMICVAGVDGYFKQVNPAFTHCLGYAEHEFLSRPILDFVHPDDRERTRKELSHLAEGHTTISFMNRYLSVEGEYRWLNWNAIPSEEDGFVIGFARDVTPQKQTEQSLIQHHRLLEAISRAQSLIIADQDPQKLFDELLNILIELTESEFGFIGEVFYEKEDVPYLRTHAIMNIAWDEETKAFCEAYRTKGVEFRNFESLFGMVMTSGEPVISNEPLNDPRQCGTLPGHPKLESFLGLPLYHGSEMLGMVGVANRENGYLESMLQFLDPFLKACSTIIHDSRVDRRRKEAETRVARLGHIVDDSLNEIYTFDVETLKFKLVNRWARENLGYSMGELREFTPLDINPKYTFETLQARLQPLRLGEQSQVVFSSTHTRKDGTIYPVEVHLQLTTHCEEPEFVAIAIDITDRLKAESELRAYLAAMETAHEDAEQQARELRAKTRDLEIAREQAETANNAKGEFVANISHEIRTPLTAILGFTDILLESVEDPVQIEAAQTIQRNGQHLLTIINDILDLSKMDFGKLKIRRSQCSPMEIIKEVVQLMAVRADAKGLTLSTVFEGSIPDEVIVDPIRLRQILLNLVGNAIKFTELGRVDIQTRFAANDAGTFNMTIDVIDTGIGIAENQIEKVFQPFSQADGSTTRNTGGTGLGLTISQRLAGLMDGEITVESELGTGSRFRVTLPVVRPEIDVENLSPCSQIEKRPGVERALTVEKQNRRRPLTGHRVLLAEDGPDNQRLIAFLLQKAGADITIVDNGQDACEATLDAVQKNQPYEVVLMDIQMPVMDGRTATLELRNAGYAGVIIALTAHALLDTETKCLRSGFDAFATKPIERAELLSLVERHLHTSRKSQNMPSDI